MHARCSIVAELPARPVVSCCGAVSTAGPGVFPPLRWRWALAQGLRWPMRKCIRDRGTRPGAFRERRRPTVHLAPQEKTTRGDTHAVRSVLVSDPMHGIPFPARSCGGCEQPERAKGPSYQQRRFRRPAKYSRTFHRMACLLATQDRRVTEWFLTTQGNTLAQGSRG